MLFCYLELKNGSQNSRKYWPEFSYEEIVVEVLQSLSENTSNAVLFSRAGGLEAALREVWVPCDGY